MTKPNVKDLISFQFLIFAHIFKLIGGYFLSESIKRGPYSDLTVWSLFQQAVTFDPKLTHYTKMFSF